jgi:HlyD family secretion protein
MDHTTQTPALPPSALDEFLGRAPPSPRAKLLRYGVIGLVLLLVLSLGYRWVAGSGADQPRYATAVVDRGDLRVTVSATGNLQPTNEVEVGSELSGLITDVTVDNNDRVQKNHVLAKLDTARLRDSVARSRAALQSAEASVAQATATAQQTKAALARLDEVLELSGGKVPSPAEMDRARAEHARALAGVQAAQASVAQARAQLSSDETNFSKAEIRSPVTGVVLRRQVDPGQTVAASFNAPVLFRIAEDLQRMQLEVKVDEADVGQVADGQRATFQVDAFPGRMFRARVARVDVGSNSSTGGAGAPSSAAGNQVVSYTAVLTVDNADGILRPGMTATAEIVTNEKKGVLLVPNAALRFSPDAGGPGAGQRGGVTRVLLPGPPRGTNSGRPRDVGIGRGSTQRVYVVGADGKPQAVQVTTGDTNGSVTEVTGDGLSEGAQVITGQLATGAK